MSLTLRAWHRQNGWPRDPSLVHTRRRNLKGDVINNSIRFGWQRRLATRRQDKKVLLVEPVQEPYVLRSDAPN